MAPVTPRKRPHESANLARIRAAIPEGAVTLLLDACRAVGYDPRAVLRNPTDAQTDAIIGELLIMQADGVIDRQRAENRRAAAADREGDGADYVNHTGDFAPDGSNSEGFEIDPVLRRRMKTETR